MIVVGLISLTAILVVYTISVVLTANAIDKVLVKSSDRASRESDDYDIVSAQKHICKVDIICSVIPIANIVMLIVFYFTYDICVRIFTLYFVRKFSINDKKVGF